METKIGRPEGETSPGYKLDQGKPAYHLLASDALEEVAKVMAYGEKKYGRDNWAKGMAFSRPFSALMRHSWAWWRGEDRDPESGFHHLACAMCSVMFLLAYELRGMAQLFDDREHLNRRDVRALKAMEEVK